MKRTALALLLTVFAFSGAAQADMITLNATEQLTPPTAAKIHLQQIIIDASSKVLQVKYRWLDSNNQPIQVRDHPVVQTWTCRNRADSPETPEDETDNCFSSIFGFSIRQQDVGVKLGIGLRNLLWNRMKQDLLTTGNDGVFDIN